MTIRDWAWDSTPISKLLLIIHVFPLQGFAAEMQTGSVAVHSCSTRHNSDRFVSELCSSRTPFLFLNTVGSIFFFSFPSRICELCGVYDEGNFSSTNAWTYLVIFNNISQLVTLPLFVCLYMQHVKKWDGWICFSPGLVCHVLPGAVLQSSARRTESDQAGGQIPVRQNGGVRLVLVSRRRDLCLSGRYNYMFKWHQMIVAADNRHFVDSSRQAAFIALLVKVGIISEARTWEWESVEAVATGLQVS